MQRRIAPWFGGFLLVLVVGFLAVFGLSDPGLVALATGLVAAAILSIAGGTVESITIGSRTVPWNVLLGAATVLVALVAVLSSVRTLETGGTDTLFTAATIVGAASLAWMGLQTARDSRHVDLDASPSRARLVGVVALAAVSMVGGALLAIVV